MTAAEEELCRLLEEHGIKHWIDFDLGSIEWMNDRTAFTALLMDNGNFAVKEISEMTAAQAIEATLGTADEG